MTVRSERPRGSIWTSRLVRALGGQFGGDPTVLHSLEQFVPLGATGRTTPPHEWGLTRDETELLQELDGSTPWYRRP